MSDPPQTSAILPLPAFFNNTLGTGTDTPLSFAISDGRVLKLKKPPTGFPCAIATAYNRSSSVIPITHIAKENDARDMRVWISANSQLPGFSLRCKSKSHEHYHISISPDLCQTFKVEVLDRELESEKARYVQLEEQWCDFDVKSQGLVAIRCVFGPGKHPILKQIGSTQSDSEPSAEEVYRNPTLDILFAVKIGTTLLALRHFAEVVELRSGTPSNTPASFPLYRHAYEPHDGGSNLCQLMLANAANSLRAPPAPRHLLKTMKSRASQSSSSPAHLADLSGNCVWSHPCITSYEQLVDIYAIALLRDAEHQDNQCLIAMNNATHRQLRALSRFQANKAKPAQFHLSRSLIENPAVEEQFNVSILDELHKCQTDSRGDFVVVADRVIALNQFQSRYLNEEQRQFVEACNTQAKCGMLKLVGSAKTGKTHTLAAVAISATILGAGLTIVGVKTNAAVGELFEALLLQRQGFDIGVIRLHSVGEESRLRQLIWDGGQVCSLADVERCSLAVQTFEHCKAMISHIGRSGSYSDYIEYAGVIDEATSNGSRRHDARDIDRWIDLAKIAETKFLQEHVDVLVSTVDTLALALENLGVQAETIILDVAAQLILPDIISVLATNGQTKRLVVAGDPYDATLPPCSVMAGMNEWGSIFSSTLYSKNNPHVIWMSGQTFYLKETFWSLPTTVEFVKSLVGVELSAHRSAHSRHGLDLNRANRDHQSALRVFGIWDFDEKPMAFIHVSGIAGKPSYSTLPPAVNWKTASKGKSVTFETRTDGFNQSGDKAIASLVDDIIRYAHIQPSEIGIITAYECDAKKLDLLIGDTYPEVKISVASKLQLPDEGKEITIVHLVSFHEVAMASIGNAKCLYASVARSKGQVFWVGDINEALKASNLLGKRTKSLSTLLDFILSRDLLVNWCAEALAAIPPGTEAMLRTAMGGNSRDASKPDGECDDSNDVGEVDGMR